MALTKKESTREGSRMKAQDQKELMRERICDCAKRLFEREGYEQVSMRQIAAEAGIAVGNLTYYFSKKEDLLKERLNDIQETFSESIQLFEIDLERGEISGKPFWEYENRTLLELLLRFLKAVEQFQKNAAIVYENYSRLQKNSTRISRNEQRMDGEDHDDIQWSYKAVVGTKSFQKRTGVGRV